ncbi:universal stress protein [Kocuria dechangensis]|uniref:Universal stress protein n=1 Tax=Kocuria dechangensis TaxID=1176249 RepID=A0A917H336_9MICC|nr:universal stress protein [Kocuria dechangensis]GGG65865.1 universal stress protein [Kocuria dechangensis]
MDGDGGRVVVNVDGSEHSKAALRVAVRLGQALQAPVEAIMCWEDPLLYEGSYGNDTVIDPEAFRANAGQRLEAVLGEVFGERRPEHLSTQLLRGRPADLLIAASTDAQMLVLGPRGVGGLLGLLLSSVTHACLAHARCPVLVVRH